MLIRQLSNSCSPSFNPSTKEIIMAGHGFSFLGADGPLAPAPAPAPSAQRVAVQVAAQNAGRQAAAKQALAQQLPGGSDRVRYQPLAIDSITTALAAGLVLSTTTAVVTTNPQRPFRAERLIIAGGAVATCPTGGGAGAIAGGNLLSAWFVNSILVGVDNQTLSTAGALPGCMFAPNAFQVGLKFATAIPGIGMSVSVTNGDTVAQRFSGAFLGTALG